MSQPNEAPLTPEEQAELTAALLSGELVPLPEGGWTLRTPDGHERFSLANDMRLALRHVRHGRRIAEGWTWYGPEWYREDLDRIVHLLGSTLYETLTADGALYVRRVDA